MTKYLKDKDAILDYRVDWSSWLAAAETIASHLVTVPTGIVKDSSTNTTTTVTAWLSGGTVGTTYPVVFRVTTNQGRVDDRTVRILVQER